MFLIRELHVDPPSVLSSKLATPRFTVTRTSGATTACEVYLKVHLMTVLVGINQRILSSCGWQECRN